MLKDLADVSINMGLKTNLEKIKMLFILFASNVKIANNNMETKVVRNYVYLEQEI